MKHYNFKSRSFNSGPHFLGLILIFCGLFVLLTPYLFKTEVPIETVFWLSGGSLFIGTCIVSYYQGTLINFADKRFKEYTSFLGYKFGEWHALPTLSGIKFTSKKQRITNTVNGVSPTLSGDIVFYYIVLLGHQEEPNLTFTFTNKKKAHRHQKWLEKGLGLGII
ncbi:MAG: hypothetical protein AAF693_22420 [Bacteroidota bacterium]